MITGYSILAKYPDATSGRAHNLLSFNWPRTTVDFYVAAWNAERTYHNDTIYVAIPATSYCA
jgi:hypothetical protein